MSNWFQRFARAVESAEPGIVDGPGPIDPQHPKPGRYDRAAADAMVDAVQPLPTAATHAPAAEPGAGFGPSAGWPDALAFTAHREPGHGGTFARLSVCAADRHLIDAIDADRCRLEAVVDRLRTENRQLTERLAARIP